MEVCVVAVVVEYAAHGCTILDQRGFMRKRIEGVCEEIRVTMSGLDGLCLPIFLVLWVMKVS